MNHFNPTPKMKEHIPAIALESASEDCGENFSLRMVRGVAKITDEWGDATYWYRHKEIIYDESDTYCKWGLWRNGSSAVRLSRMYERFETMTEARKAIDKMLAAK